MTTKSRKFNYLLASNSREEFISPHYRCLFHSPIPLPWQMLPRLVNICSVAVQANRQRCQSGRWLIRRVKMKLKWHFSTRKKRNHAKLNATIETGTAAHSFYRQNKSKSQFNIHSLERNEFTKLK